MKILISLLFVKAGKVGGAEHMAYNLVIGLAKLPVSLVLVATRPDQISDSFKKSIGYFENVEVNYTGSKKSRFIQEQFLALSKEKFDGVIFPNYFCPPLVRTNLGTVLTVIHDLQYKKMPENFPLIKRLWLSLCHSISLRNSDKVVAISNFVRDDILHFFDHKFAIKLTTIYNPISWERFNSSGVGSGHDREYLLSVAAHYPHKNILTLVKAFDEIKEQIPQYDLLLIGQFSGALSSQVSYGQDILQVIEELGIEHRVKALGYLNDAELGEYYAGASVFVFPSLFEGFGMPPIEAMGLGVPVITTKCGSLEEVTLGRANYVENPKDVKELSAEILRVLDEDTNMELVKCDAEKVRNCYLPDRIAKQYTDLISD